jgi:hypothetical protein
VVEDQNGLERAAGLWWGWRMFSKMQDLMSKVPLNKVIPKLAGLGVPALVLIVAIAMSGFAGAAALTVALAALGGPLGMLGGIAVLGLLVVLSNALAEYGFEAVFNGVISELVKKGKTKEHILAEIEKYPIGEDLKQRLRKEVDRFFASQGKTKKTQGPKKPRKKD